MAVLDDMDRKLDQLLSLASEEINVHPDIVNPHAPPMFQQLPITTNMSVSLYAEWHVETNEHGRFLVLKLRGPYYEWLVMRTWRCVWRPFPGEPGEVADRPGMLKV